MAISCGMERAHSIPGIPDYCQRCQAHTPMHCLARLVCQDGTDRAR